MTAEEFIHLEYQKAYSQTKPGETYPVYPTDYLFPLIQEFARIKCLESIKNTRYAAIDIVCKDEIIDTVHAIHNISNQDVMPEL